MKIQITIATKSDLETVANLRYKMFDNIGTTDLLIDNFFDKTVSFYQKAYDTNECIHLLAELDGKIIGCAGAIIKSDFPSNFFKSGKYGYIMDVFVEEEYRKKGIAKKLLDELLIWFKKKNISTVKLDASKVGVPLYAKMGFESSIEMSINFNEKN